MMKKLPFTGWILASVLLIASAMSPAFAQTGTVAYDETIKMDIELPPEMESMRDQIPQSRTSAKMLYFTEVGTLMKNAPKAEAPAETVIGGEGMMIRMVGPREDNETFIDLDEEQVIEKRDFLGRTFLITGERPAHAWRLTGEQSEYLGYACQKAVATRDSTVVEAWFTSEIPVSAGPAQFGGLPGLILVLSQDDGRLTYSATAVDLDADVAEVVTAPSGGKAVTRDEFNTIVDEKMKEMGATRGRGGNMIRMRIDHD